MAKRYNGKDMRNMLTHVVATYLSKIHEASVGLDDLKLTEEEWKEQGEKWERASELLKSISLLNFVLAPLFGIARQQFPASATFIDSCEKNHNEALKRGAYKECECVGCKDQSERTNNGKE